MGSHLPIATLSCILSFKLSTTCGGLTKNTINFSWKNRIQDYNILRVIHLPREEGIKGANN